MLRKTLFFVASAFMLEGCVAGQSIALPYEAEKVESQQSISVAVDVEDRRPFILDGHKDPNYIGHYRAGFGNPWDVTTESKKALADILQEDLVQELDALGFSSGAASASRSLLIEIQDFNFNAYVNGEFWYKLNVVVFDENREQLASSKLGNNVVIEGSAWSGPKKAMEKEVPAFYALMVKAIIRKNDEVMSALVGTSVEIGGD
jgi:hypothetical protein